MNVHPTLRDLKPFKIITVLYSFCLFGLLGGCQLANKKSDVEPRIALRQQLIARIDERLEPYLGVELQQVTDKNGVPSLIIRRIKPGALMDTGLKPGDSLLRMDGAPASLSVLKEKLRGKLPGEEINLTVRINGQKDIRAIPVMIVNKSDFAGPWSWMKGTAADVDQARISGGMSEWESLQHRRKLMANLESRIKSLKLQEAYEGLKMHLHENYVSKASSQVMMPLHDIFLEPHKVIEFKEENVSLWWQVSASLNSKEILRFQDELWLAMWASDLPELQSLTIEGKSFDELYLAHERFAARQLTGWISQLEGTALSFEPSDVMPAYHYGVQKEWRDGLKVKLLLMVELLKRSLLQTSERQLQSHELVTFLKRQIQCLPCVDERSLKSVKGKVQGVYDSPWGLIVLGGEGDNTYDMRQIAVVIDPSGHDEYHFEVVDDETLSQASTKKLEWIVDLRGNDRYRIDSEHKVTASRHIGGPASGLGRLAAIVDHEGNDIYHGARGSVAAGVFGVGLIVDFKGDDRYQSHAICQGYGMYGLGWLLDLSGQDQYLSGGLAQGLGSTKGVGILQDVSGHDFYKCNGAYPSAYKNNGHFLGIGQGVGFGFRPHDMGGIGLLLDGGGNDRYLGGEFTQGGGYFYGLGMLHDRAGHDLYSASRYAQAFSAHGGIGILEDEAGNDIYLGQIAASQSGAWDESISLLIDHKGDDFYSCTWLGMGAASMQSLAYFFDLGGRDIYRPRNSNATLGESSGDSYHFDTSNVYSFSICFDDGPEEDEFPANRRGKSNLKTGSLNPDKPADSSLWGIFIDTSSDQKKTEVTAYQSP